MTSVSFLHRIPLLLLAFLFATGAAFAIEIPPNDAFVTDEANILSDEEELTLETTLTDYQRQTSNEIAILTIASMQGEDIAEAAVEVGRKWGVGGEDNNNGIVILVAFQDREVFIATGYGLEGAVPDIVAKGIIEEDIVPHFREGEEFEGLLKAVDSLQKHIGGEYTAERYTGPSAEGFFPWILFFAFMAFDYIAALFARTKSWWLGGIAGAAFGVILTALFSWWVSIPILVGVGLFFDFLVSKHGYNRGRGGRGGGFWGGGGRGSGGGGFGGFGGGSFGGGGARGRW